MNLFFILFIEWNTLKMMYKGLLLYRAAQTFSDIFRPMEGEFLKRFLTYLCCTKYNELKQCHSNIQKSISCKMV